MRQKWLGILCSLMVVVLALASGLSACSDAAGSLPVDAGLVGTGAAPDSGADGAVATSFNVIGAAAVSSTRVQIMFDATPDAARATNATNYAIAGLAMTAPPTLTGNVVTLTTALQETKPYLVNVQNVVRLSDGKPLLFKSATFVGRAPFDVASATSTSAVTLTITFDAKPHLAQATKLANYTVAGLTLSGVPQLVGNTVTLTTSSQANQSYILSVAGVTREIDGEPLTVTTATWNGTNTFNVASAASTSNTKMTVTFDAPPNAAQAMTLANYAVPGLTPSGAPQLNGSVVTITTSAQLAQSYTVTVTGVTRASDSAPLVTASRNFAGRPTFNVGSVVALSATSIRVTFDAAPNAVQATTLASYAVSGLTLSAPQLDGNDVILTTTPQLAQTYTLVVSNVTRNADNDALTDPNADFTGRVPFNVVSAVSTSNTTMTVTFDAAPNSGQAALPEYYTFNNGLAVVGAPVPAGNTVTITTTAQTAQSYTLTVVFVTRAGDAETLLDNDASFTGTP